MQSFKSYILIIILLLPNLALAKKFGMALGAGYNSSSVFRGAQTWSKGSVMAGPSFTFFERIALRGPSLTYSQFDRKSAFELDFGLQLMDDDEPLISLGDQAEDYRNQRDSTWELQLKFKYKFGFFNKFYVGGMLARDIDETKAFYSELHLGSPFLVKYTSLEYRLSFAEKEANQYIYGPEAVSGKGWQEFSVKYVMPFVPWDGIVINSLSYSKVLQEENVSADFVRQRDKNWVFSTFIVWNLL